MAIKGLACELPKKFLLVDFTSTENTLVNAFLLLVSTHSCWQSMSCVWMYACYAHAGVYEHVYICICV